MTVTRAAGSASIEQPDYWWYRARADLLRSALEGYVHDPRLVLDVGSADGPSVDWLRGKGKQVSLDLDSRGLDDGGVCGSAMALPFADETFDVVAAFDVVEHCEPEADVFNELARVLTPGGHLLLSVPAYQWAWTQFDDLSGHHRRYSRSRVVDAVQTAGMIVERATYAFMSVFPFFATDRLISRVRERFAGPTTAEAELTLPQVPRALERMFLGLSRVDCSLLGRGNLPFGSSVVVAATKPIRDGYDRAAKS